MRLGTGRRWLGWPDGKMGVAAVLVAALGGCVPEPPPLIAFPGDGKSFATFIGDDTACRQAVAQVVAPAAAVARGAQAAAPQTPNLAYAQCMVAHGDKVGPPPMAPRPVYPAYGPVYSGFGDTYPWLYGDGRF